MTFVYGGSAPPPSVLTAKFTGSIASFLVNGEAKDIFERFRWGQTYSYTARIRWQGEILEDYTLFECFNFVRERDINFQRTRFFAIDRETQRAVHPAPKFQKSEDLHQWHAAVEQKYRADVLPPVELRIDRLCLTPSFVRQNDVFLIGLGYIPRHYRSISFVNKSFKDALGVSPINGLAFEATDYVEV